MNTVAEISAVRAFVAEAKADGKRVAFVPTMGNLHSGHISLVELAKQHADVVIVSIFVNPLQFGPGEDLDAYPRTLAADQQQLEAAGVALLFTPTEPLIYPEGMSAHTQVSVPGLDSLHCGKSRPGHFTGVATVVTKLLGIVQPDVAIFGEKDFQQLAVIRKLVRDLYLPVEIVGAPIARNDKGLALSSRNGYLSAEELAVAPELQASLQQLKASLLAGSRDFDLLSAEAQQRLQQVGFKPDFINICQRDTLLPATADDRQLVILAAAVLGRARLIDNLVVDL